MSERWHIVECTILRHSGGAVLILVHGEELWIPKSQIEDAADLPAAGNAEVIMTAWIAKQKGLI